MLFKEVVINYRVLRLKLELYDLLWQLTESTMDIVADYMLETTVILLTNPQDFNSSKHTVAEGRMLMTHATILLSPIVLQILCLI